MIYEDASHRLRRRAVEVPPSFDRHVAQTRQRQIGLVHQVRRLQRVVTALVAKQAPGQVPQLPVHDAQQLLERVAIAGVPPSEQLGNVTHMWRERLRV